MADITRKSAHLETDGERKPSRKTGQAKGHHGKSAKELVSPATVGTEESDTAPCAPQIVRHQEEWPRDPGPGNPPISIAAFEYIEYIQTLDDPAMIQEAFARALNRLGVTNFALLEFGPDPTTFERRVIDDRMPDEWKERYFRQRYAADDPVITEVLSNTEPFLWSEALTKQRAEKRQRQIFHEAAEFHLKDGMCIPIFGPHSYRAWVTLAGPYPNICGGARAALHVMALYTHNRLVRLLRPKYVSRPSLTRREADCLTWVAQGKSDWEIGEILKISETTVHWYIENSKRKIGVSTRMQAVVGAISAGMIHI